MSVWVSACYGLTPSSESIRRGRTQRIVHRLGLFSIVLVKLVHKRKELLEEVLGKLWNAGPRVGGEGMCSLTRSLAVGSGSLAVGSGSSPGR